MGVHLELLFLLVVAVEFLLELFYLLVQRRRVDVLLVPDGRHRSFELGGARETLLLHTDGRHFVLLVYPVGHVILY